MEESSLIWLFVHIGQGLEKAILENYHFEEKEKRLIEMETGMD